MIARLRNAWRALCGRPPVLTLAMHSRISAEVEGWPPWDPQGLPYGGVVDTVLKTLYRARLLEPEPGFFGGVPPAPLVLAADDPRVDPNREYVLASLADEDREGVEA